MVFEGPGVKTWPTFLYLVNPGPKLSASLPLNQLSIEMLRCRGKDCPALGPPEGTQGYLSSPGHRQMPVLFPQ